MAKEEKTPEAAPPAQAAAPAEQQMRLSVSTAGMETSYSNFFRVTATFEELVMDFGLHSGLMTQSGPESVKLTDRIVLSFPTAKRLHTALQMALGRHEQVFGVIETEPQRRMRIQPGQAGGGAAPAAGAR
jgi:hypothetical protein